MDLEDAVKVLWNLCCNDFLRWLFYFFFSRCRFLRSFVLIKDVVTAQIPGIEVMDLEDAVKVLWKLGIYAESGMGCTGPIIRVSDANLAKAEEELKKSGYIN